MRIQNHADLKPNLKLFILHTTVVRRN